MCGVSRSSMLVHLVRRDKHQYEIINFLNNNRIKFKFISSLLDGKYCNKIQQLASEEIGKFDRVILCDCDIAFSNNIEKQLPFAHVSGKVVDFDNPDIDALKKVFDYLGLSYPETIATSSGKVTFIGNFNGGLYTIPSHLVPALYCEWKAIAAKLFSSTKFSQLLPAKKHKHLDQISFCAACKILELPLYPLPLEFNFPTHLNLQINRPLEKINVFHYHSNYLENGKLGKSQNKEVNLQIKKINKHLFSENELIIHIGTPKTGSSAIQGMLSQYSELLGIKYPQKNLNTGNFIAFSLLSQTPRYVHKIRKSSNEIYQSLDLKNGVTVISSEAFYSCSTLKHEGSMLPEKLKKHLPSTVKPKIVVYLRDYFDFIYSLYSQYVKLHAHNKFIVLDFYEFIKEYYFYGYFNYYKIISYWESVFGTGSVFVKKYPKYGNCITDDFLTNFKCSITLEKNNNRKNINISREAIEIKRLINALPISEELKLHTLQPILSKYSESRTKGFAKYNKELANQICSLLAEDRNSISKKYNIELSFNIEEACAGEPFTELSDESISEFLNLLKTEDISIYDAIKVGAIHGVDSKVFPTAYAASRFQNFIG